jgi:hypothetical protein
MKRVVIEQSSTGLFLLDDDHWTPSIEGAMSFENSASAARYAQRHDIRNIRVRLTFGNREYDVVIPISDHATVRIPVLLKRNTWLR